MPVRLETFADSMSLHPDGNVMVPNGLMLRDDGRNPYAGYGSSPSLNARELPEGVEPMVRDVVARPAAGPPAIIALAQQRMNGSLDVGNLAFTWRAGQSSAMKDAEISDSRDIGTAEVNDRAAQFALKLALL